MSECSDCLDVPVIVDLTSSIALARFFVGVFVMVFLGVVTFYNTRGCPPVLHIIVCLSGSSVFSFLLTKCVFKFSSSFEKGWSNGKLSE